MYSQFTEAYRNHTMTCDAQYVSTGMNGSYSKTEDVLSIVIWASLSEAHTSGQARPTLVGCIARRMCMYVCMYVCMHTCGHIENLN